MPNAPDPESIQQRELSSPRFMSVEECRKSLPIKISRRMVVNYIRAAGPEFYQEHRRQLFLTPEQWAAVVAGIKPRSGSLGAAIGSSAHALSPEAASARALALTASDM